MKRYTLRDNLYSIALGIVIAIALAVLLRPVYVAEQEERKIRQEELKAEILAQKKAESRMELEAAERNTVGASMAPTYEEIELTEEIVEETEPEVDETEVWHLAALIHAEVGNQSEQSKYLCGAVVLNRVSSPYFANTIDGVIYQEGQYQCTWNGGYDRALTEYDEVSYEVALDLLANGIPDWIPRTVVWQAEFKQGDGVFMQIGNTYYCYTNGVQD